MWYILQDIWLEIECLVQFLLPFLRAIGISIGLGPSEFKEHDISKGIPRPDTSLGPSEFKEHDISERIPGLDKSVAFWSNSD